MRSKRILVTGGTGTVGSEAIRCLSTLGHEVVAQARRKIAGIPTILGDFSNPTAYKDVVSAICEFDAVIFAHGVFRCHAEVEADPKLEAWMFQVNYFSTNMMIRELRQGAHGIVISSIAGVRGSTSGDASYAASKSAINGSVQTSGSHLPNAYLTAIAPGPISGPMTEGRGYSDQDLLTPLEVVSEIETILAKPVDFNRKICVVKKTDGQIDRRLASK